MKIVFVNDHIYEYASGAPSACGGAERQQWLLARTLVRNGWSVTVGVREAVITGSRVTIDAVEFVGIDKGHILPAWYRFLSCERPDWWYWRAADHWWGPAVEVAKLTGVRTIFAAAFDTDVQPSRALFRHPRCWPMYAWGLLRTDRIFVQHRGQLCRLASRWRSKAHLVPSIAGETMSVKPSSERAQYVAWVGTLRQHKRPDLLIEIARNAPRIHFVVCGGTSTLDSSVGYGERIVEGLLALPNVEYRGKTAPQTAQQVIADASILLSTSDEEGFPNTFLQAWSSGTSVVSLRIDPDDIIKRAKLGTVPNTVADAIADVKALLDSPQRRDEIAVRARNHVSKVHSESAVLAAFESATRMSVSPADS